MRSWDDSQALTARVKSHHTFPGSRVYAHFILILRMTHRSLSELRSAWCRIFLNKIGVQSDNAFHFEPILAGTDSEPHVSEPKRPRCLYSTYQILLPKYGLASAVRPTDNCVLQTWESCLHGPNLPDIRSLFWSSVVTASPLSVRTVSS